MLDECLWRLDNIQLRYIRLFLLVTGIISIGSLVAIVYTSQHAREGCPSITQCQNMKYLVLLLQIIKHSMALITFLIMIGIVPTGVQTA